MCQWFRMTAPAEALPRARRPSSHTLHTSGNTGQQAQRNKAAGTNITLPASTSLILRRHCDVSLASEPELRSSGSSAFAAGQVKRQVTPEGE
jgi:hypothetical protein